MDQTTVSGRIGRISLADGERPRLSFSIASDRSYKDRNGAKVERTQWYNCTLWGNRAIALSQYMAVGDMTLIQGQVGVSTYENREGEVVASLDLTVSDVTLLPNARRESGAQEASPAPKRAAAPRKGKAPARKAVAHDFDEDGLPFD